MRYTTTLLLAVGLLALAGCTSTGDDKTATADAKTAPTTSAVPQKLEPTWGPKLQAAAGKDAEATAACQQPSSNQCARYVKNIMAVVGSLEAEIDRTGQAYPKSRVQIGKMQDAASEYLANECQGDVTADDPDSSCWGVATVTVGAAALDMTLLTDEAGL